jgi:DNA-binding NarL/FixJ family response regulator
MVVDDFPLVRQAVVATLTGAKAIEVVGEAGDGIDALAEARRTRPDVAVVDLKMPRCSGLELLRNLRDELPSVRALVFTASCRPERVLDAAAGGAHGYLTKRASATDLIAAVEAVYQGVPTVSPMVASGLFGALARRRRLGPLLIDPPLTRREVQVLQLLARGLADGEIASRLFVSVRTVQSHLQEIRWKVGLKQRSALAGWAVDRGIASAADPGSPSA